MMKYILVFPPAGRFAVQIRSRRICHGILAPNAKHRSEIIPDAQKIEKNTSDTQDDTPQSSASVRISWARLLTKPPGAGFERHMPARRVKTKEWFS